MLDLLQKGKSISLEGIGMFSFRRQYETVGIGDDFDESSEFSVNFNPSITFRDRALIEYVAEQLSIAESNSELVVGKILRTIRAKLDRGESVFLEGIGELSQDTDGSYLFFPKPDFMATTNFDFFGNDRDEFPILPLESSSNHSNGVFSNRWKTVFIIIGLLFILGCLIGLFYLKFGKTEAQKLVNSPINVEKTNIKPVEDKVKEDVSAKSDAFVEMEVKEAVVTKTPLNEIISRRTATINMGEFSLESDALKLVQTLKKVDYDARLELSNHLFAVVVFIEYEEESTLKAALLSIRRNFVSNAFIQNFNLNNE
jgi:nucleoid DNA-binding protein